MPTKKTVVDINGVSLTLSNLDKILYPAAEFSKAHVIDYYIRIAPALIPHLINRPLTLKRYPNGVKGNFFYQKRCPSHRPEWMATVPVWSKHNGKDIDFCLVNDLPSLVWAANLASLELHPSLSLAANIAQPTMLVFDLDPGPPATIIECTQVALWLRQVFMRQNIASFVKTSGSKGLQIYVPLNTTVTYEQTKQYAHALARALENKHPDRVVSKMKKSLRTGKVLVDWSQNDEHKTTVCVYSLRAREKPTVSTPVTWDEVETCWQNKDPAMLEFTSECVLDRVSRFGDLFAPVLKLKQTLPN